MRTTRNTLTCDRCAKTEFTKSFSSYELRKLGRAGWTKYTTATTQNKFSWPYKDLCPGCTDQMRVVACSKSEWLPVVDLNSYEKMCRASRDSLEMKLADVITLRDELTQRIKDRRKKTRKENG